MSKTYKKWSTEEELVISRMRKEGSTIRIIAKFLNRSEASVTCKIKQMLDACKLEKLDAIKRMSECNKRKARGSKIDYKEIKTRIENGGIRNVQKTLRTYAKETGISINTLNQAYYSKSQTRTRIKDMVRVYTVISPTCILEGANKNTDKPVLKISIWKKLKSWLSSLWLS
jgi:IS30 family transposase